MYEDCRQAVLKRLCCQNDDVRHGLDERTICPIQELSNIRDGKKNLLPVLRWHRATYS